MSTVISEVQLQKTNVWVLEQVSTDIY